MLARRVPAGHAQWHTPWPLPQQPLAPDTAAVAFLDHLRANAANVPLFKAVTDAAAAGLDEVEQALVAALHDKFRAFSRAMQRARYRPDDGGGVDGVIQNPAAYQLTVAQEYQHCYPPPSPWQLTAQTDMYTQLVRVMTLDELQYAARHIAGQAASADDWLAMDNLLAIQPPRPYYQPPIAWGLGAHDTPLHRWGLERDPVSGGIFMACCGQRVAADGDSLPPGCWMSLEPTDQQRVLPYRVWFSDLAAFWEQFWQNERSAADFVRVMRASIRRGTAWMDYQCHQNMDARIRTLVEAVTPAMSAVYARIIESEGGAGGGYGLDPAINKQLRELVSALYAFNAPQHEECEAIRDPTATDGAWADYLTHGILGVTLVREAFRSGRAKQFVIIDGENIELLKGSTIDAGQLIRLRQALSTHAFTSKDDIVRLLDVAPLQVYETDTQAALQRAAQAVNLQADFPPELLRLDGFKDMFKTDVSALRRAMADFESTTRELQRAINAALLHPDDVNAQQALNRAATARADATVRVQQANAAALRVIITDEQLALMHIVRDAWNSGPLMDVYRSRAASDVAALKLDLTSEELQMLIDAQSRIMAARRVIEDQSKGPHPDKDKLLDALQNARKLLVDNPAEQLRLQAQKRADDERRRRREAEAEAERERAAKAAAAAEYEARQRALDAERAKRKVITSTKQADVQRPNMTTLHQFMIRAFQRYIKQPNQKDFVQAMDQLLQEAIKEQSKLPKIQGNFGRLKRVSMALDAVQAVPGLWNVLHNDKNVRRDFIAFLEAIDQSDDNILENDQNFRQALRVFVDIANISVHGQDFKLSKEVVRYANEQGAPPPLKSPALFGRGQHKYENSSCPYDSLFAALFKIPDLWLQRTIRTATEVHVPFGLCSENDANATHRQLIDEIHYIQSEAAALRPAVCQLPLVWRKCFPSRDAGDDLESKVGDPREKIGNIIAFYKLVDDFRVYDIGQDQDDWNTTEFISESSFLPGYKMIMVQKVDVRVQSKPNVNVPTKISGFRLISVLVHESSAGHWTALVCEAWNNQWWHFDAWRKKDKVFAADEMDAVSGLPILATQQVGDQRPGAWIYVLDDSIPKALGIAKPAPKSQIPPMIKSYDEFIENLERIRKSQKSSTFLSKSLETDQFYNLRSALIFFAGVFEANKQQVFLGDAVHHLPMRTSIDLSKDADHAISSFTRGIIADKHHPQYLGALGQNDPTMLIWLAYSILRGSLYDSAQKDTPHSTNFTFAATMMSSDYIKLLAGVFYTKKDEGLFDIIEPKDDNPSFFSQRVIRTIGARKDSGINNTHMQFIPADPVLLHVATVLRLMLHPPTLQFNPTDLQSARVAIESHLEAEKQRKGGRF